mgnify:CR=1 FL=1
MDPLQEMLMRKMGMNMGAGGLPKARDSVHALACTLEDVYGGVSCVRSCVQCKDECGYV